MRIQVVGIEDQNYTIKDTGYHFDGLKLHCIDLQTVKDDKQDGCLVATYKMDRTSPLIDTPEVGKVYDVFFDPKGKKIEYMLPVADEVSGEEEE